MTQQPADQPPQVGPQPVPQQVNVTTVQGPNGSMVLVQITGPTGIYVTFIDPEAAVAIAKQISDAAATAKTGLVVAAGLSALNGNGRH